MTQGGATGGEIPAAILAVLPSDPHEQLDLARRITSQAIASRVAQLEAETLRLRRQAGEKDRVIADLQDRVCRLETTSQEAEARLRTALQENDVLVKERDSLAVTSKKLARDLTKLETFKRHLMQSLSDENPQTEIVDIAPCEQSDISSSLKDAKSVSSASSMNLSRGPSDTAPRPIGQRLSISPWLTPNATPKTASTTGSPRGHSTVGSPKKLSCVTSPTKSRNEVYPSMSPWYPSSQRSSAANSPPRARSAAGHVPRIDGKEFFRQARSRLSYEQFTEFLANIKELNAQKQTRQETLRKAEEIFGTDNRDLYASFQDLLTRNLRS